MGAGVQPLENFEFSQDSIVPSSSWLYFINVSNKIILLKSYILVI